MIAADEIYMYVFVRLCGCVCSPTDALAMYIASRGFQGVGVVTMCGQISHYPSQFIILSAAPIG